MTHTIFAWTEPTPPGGYPAYVNISRDENGRHTITVRSRGNGGRDTATADIPVESLESLLCDLADDLYRDDPPGVAIADGGRSNAPVVPARPIRTDPAGAYRCTACSWAGDTPSNCPKCATEVTINDGVDVDRGGKMV